MNLGFRMFGVADIGTAQEKGRLRLPGGDAEVGWNYLIWLLAGTITDIVEGISPPAAETTMAEAILRVLGVPEAEAAAFADSPLPPYPLIPIDFSYILNDEADAKASAAGV